MKTITCLTTLVMFCFCAFAKTDPSQLLTSLRNAAPGQDRIEAYKHIFKYYEYSKPDSALYYLDMGMKEVTAAKNKNGIAAMTVLSAYNDVAHGRLALAREKYENALAMFQSLGQKRGIATVHNAIGVIDAKSGKFSDATLHVLSALKMFESLNDINGIVSCYQKLGTINENSENLQKALDYYFKAIGIMEQHPVKGTEFVWLYNNIGVVYGKMGQLQQAQNYFEMALKGSQDPASIDVRILTLNNLGILYDKTGDDKKSLGYFDEAIKITKDKNLPENFARLSVSRASVVSKTDPAAAITVLTDALKTVQTLGLKNLEADIYYGMMESYDRLGKYKEAFKTLHRLKKLEDSLTNTDKVKEIMNLQAVYELEKSNTKLALVEQRSDANTRIKNIIIAVAVGLAVLLVLLSLLYCKTAKLNDQLKKRETELQKSNEIKDKLFSIIGHDLRGPIGNVPIMLQLLEDTTTTPDERQYIQESLIVHSRASMETLDKLLYWGQTQIKGIGIKQSTFAVGEHIINNTNLIKSTAAQKQITIINTIPPETTIWADPTHFDFIVRNLLSNAVKFTHNGGTVTLAADSIKKDGHVVFAVRDTGIGIRSEILKNIFQPFSTSTRGTADEKGTSIGLMLCKEFVTENGGEIWIETREGIGSTFYFSLRAA